MSEERTCRERLSPFNGADTSEPREWLQLSPQHFAREKDLLLQDQTLQIFFSNKIITRRMCHVLKLPDGYYQVNFDHF